MTRLPERIEGDGILLRRWRPGDAELLARAVSESTEHLAPWMAWMRDEPMSLEDRRALYAHREDEWHTGGDVHLGLFVEGELAGSFGLHWRGRSDTLDIGYWLHPAFLGRGVATTAAGLLTDAAFSVPEVVAVEIRHDEANTASGGIPRRLGYRLVGKEAKGKEAPAEVGIDWTWRVDRSGWR